MNNPLELAAQPLLDRSWEGSSSCAGSDAAALRHAAVTDAVRRACAVVAPLWPLDRFVAVNPFMGLAGRSFGDAAFQLARSTGARSVLTLREYAGLLAEGRFGEADIAAALAARPAGEGLSCVQEVLTALRMQDGPEVEPVPTIADCVDRLHGTRWAAAATDAISRFCAAHFDEGQAAWTSPWQGMEPYEAWRSAAAFDLFPEAAGLKGFRQVVAKLPESPVGTIDAVLATLGVGEQSATHYLARALWSVHGWAAMASQKHWGDEAGAEKALSGLLAIRLAWDAAVLALHDEPDVRAALQTALATPAAAGRNRRCQQVREDGKFIEAGENDNLIVQRLTTGTPGAFGIFGYSFLDQNRARI
ncbi:putative inorganic carbon transporter subunit DabA, partial [Nostoc sp. NIES-2111]